MADAAARNAKSGAKDPKAAAKDVKAQAKAAKKAEKARKKASNDPKDMGRIRQIVRAYQVTHEYDKALPYLMLGAFLLPIVLGAVVGVLCCSGSWPRCSCWFAEQSGPLSSVTPERPVRPR
jgi:hypothetical protein